MTELEIVKVEFKNLILGTCNTIGCKECPYKYEYGESGPACRSNELQDKEFELKQRGKI